MNNNEADITDESIEVPSPQKKFMPFLHQIPALKMNKSKLLAKILHGQLQNSPSQVFTPKKTPKTPQVPSSPKERHPALSQMLNKYRRSEVGSASKITIFKEEPDSAIKRDLMPEISPKSQSQALKELYKASVRSKPQSGQLESCLPSVRKSMGNIVLADPELDLLPYYSEKPKGNEKNPSSNETGPLKGIFFSDSRNRATVYQQRFITLKAKGQAESNNNMFMPKIKQKHDILSPKPANKHPSSQESYTATATDSLGLNIHVKSSLQEGSTQKLVWSGEEKMTSQYSNEKSLKTNKSHRRITSVGIPTGLTHSSDKEATITLSKIASINSPNNKKFSTHAEGKPMQLNAKKSANGDKKVHQNLLETNRQTFQFEKKAVVQEEQKEKGADLRLSLGASLIAKRIGCENVPEQIKLKPITKDQKEKLMAMLTKDSETKNKKESLKYVDSKIESIETQRLRSSQKFPEKEENSLQDLVQMIADGEKEKKHDYSFERYELSEEFMKNEGWGSSQGTMLNEKIFSQQQKESIIQSNKSPKNLKMKINVQGKKK